MGSERDKALQFACECVSARGGYSDPWAAVARHKLLPNGTKEAILNLVARGPKTIAELAKELDLSPPSVHTHVNEMLKSELLRESAERDKRHPLMRYYEPNFPVIKAEDRAEVEALCDELAGQVADLFERKSKQLKRAFSQTDLTSRGWEFTDLAQYFYASVQRRARQLLEERGTLPHREKHRNGLEWVFWAEEP